MTPDKDRQVAEGIIDWMNCVGWSDVGEVHLKRKIVSALATVRQEERNRHKDLILSAEMFVNSPIVDKVTRASAFFKRFRDSLNELRLIK